VASPDKAGAQEEQVPGSELGWLGQRTLMRDDRDTWGTRSRKRLGCRRERRDQDGSETSDEGASVHHGGASLSDSSDPASTGRV